MLNNNTAERCYELIEDGERVAVAAYGLNGDVITFTHTEVAPAHEGRGHGGKLVRFALDDARQRGLKVIPACTFFAAYIERHPEYETLQANRRG